MGLNGIHGVGKGKENIKFLFLLLLLLICHCSLIKFLIHSFNSSFSTGDLVLHSER